MSSNISLEDYNQFLDSLGSKIRTSIKKVIVVGGFNAKSPEWGSPSEDRRRRLVAEWLSNLNLTVVNRGGTPTFERREELSKSIKNWKVLNEKSASYHNCIN